MDSRLADMVRGVAGAPDRMRFLRGWAIFDAGDVIERRGDNSLCHGYMLCMADLIWLARTGIIEDATEEARHAAA